MQCSQRRSGQITSNDSSRIAKKSSNYGLSIFTTDQAGREIVWKRCVPAPQPNRHAEGKRADVDSRCNYRRARGLNMQLATHSIEPEASINSDQDVLIVGAGPGGLACSLLLAKAGLKVKIIEKSDCVGGRTKVIEKDGYRYDNGPTFFHYTEIIEEIFQAIGKDAHEELNLIKIDPNYRLVFGEGGALNASTDMDYMTKQIEQLCGKKDAEGFKKYVLDNRKKLKLSKSL